MRFLRVTGLILFAFLLFSFAFAATPETKLTVHVSTAETGRNVEGASVIVRFRPGAKKLKITGARTSWETKTSQEGRVAIPAIPRGQVAIQIIAKNYQTFGQVYELTEPEQTIEIKLNPPQAQYSEDSKTK